MIFLSTRLFVCSNNGMVVRYNFDTIYSPRTPTFNIVIQFHCIQVTAHLVVRRFFSCCCYTNSCPHTSYVYSCIQLYSFIKLF